MLLNMTENVVKIKYNEQWIETKPKEFLDVRDFGITVDQMLAVEAHIIKKNPGMFSQEKGTLVATTSKEAEKQIIALQNNLNETNAKNVELEKSNFELQERIRFLKNNQDGYEEKVKGLKSIVSELKAKLKAKDMPEEK